MRALALATLALLLTPNASAGTRTFVLDGALCMQDLVATSVPSPLVACRVHVEVTVGVDAADCTATTCAFTTQGGAAYFSSLPGYEQVYLDVYNPEGGSPWTCVALGAAPGTSASCSGATSGNVVTLAAGQCRQLAIHAFGYTALAPTFGAPSAVHVAASMPFKLCRDAHGAPSV